MSIKVYDFFSGCGGTSAGLKAAGMQIVLGIDIDPDAKMTFETNFPETSFIHKDIRKIAENDIAPYIDKSSGSKLLFSCCAPCQSFSRRNRNRNSQDARALLLSEFARFVKHYLPDLIFVENVPGIQTLADTPGPFQDFKNLLTSLNYKISHKLVKAQVYGVPQHRERLVLTASLFGEVLFPEKTHGPGTNNPIYPTVWECISDLPPIAAGELHPDVPNHQSPKLTEINIKRMKATPVGGSRLNWPQELVLACHSKLYQSKWKSSHTDVYGRMRKDQPATALTARCTSLSNGRFGHPEQNRAISVREAACIQTFPREFIFKGSPTSAARQVGNAVPVLLAKRFGEAFIQHLNLYNVGV